MNIIFERLGGVYFAARENWNPDIAVALMWTASGLGLTIGMLIAHRTSIWLDRNRSSDGFIGWTLVIHGIVFSIAGFMPSLLLFAVFALFHVRSSALNMPFRKRFFNAACRIIFAGGSPRLDRGAELTMFGLSSYFAGEAMFYITPQTLTVISGILSAFSGLIWFVRQGSKDTWRERPQQAVTEQI